MKGEGNMNGIEKIAKSLRKISDKDSTAYKVTDYYFELMEGNLNELEKTKIRDEVLKIEMFLKDWIKEHEVNNSGFRSPEESALILIDDLREKGLLN